MFMGPWDQGGPWNPQGIEGVHRFLRRVWTVVLDPSRTGARRCRWRGAALTVQDRGYAAEHNVLGRRRAQVR